MQDPLEVTAESEFPAESADCKPAPRWLTRTLLVVTLLGMALTLVAWYAGSEKRALRTLPEAERRPLFERTLQNLKTVCASPAASMRDFCEEQARFAKAFPECDDACYALAERQLSRVQLPR